MALFGFGGKEAVKRQKPLVLVVDDNAALAEVVCDLLATMNCDSVSADNGPDALKTVEEKKPDLVLLDVVMPAMSGVSVLRALKQNAATSSLPVIMVSGEQKGYDLDTAFKLGAADYIIKPVRREEFRVKVGAVLAPLGFSVPPLKN